MEQYYKVLGLKSNATEEEVKKTYRSLSKKYHPDLNPGDDESEAKFKEVVEAYEYVTGKRKVKEQPPNPFSGGGNPFGRGGFNPFGMTKGRTIIYNLVIDLEESFSGVQKPIVIPKKVICTPCDGNGGVDPQTCSHCSGQGATRQGNFVFMCNACAGQGETYTSTCTSCNGNGHTIEEKTYNITLPKGIANNTQILKQGFGNEVKDGISGDILINITVRNHSVFDVDGLNLKTTIDIPILELFLGTEIDFQTLSGEVKITIPKLLDLTKSFRLRGKGMEVKNDIKGDLYVKINPTFPTEITPQEEALVNALKNSPSFID